MNIGFKRTALAGGVLVTVVAAVLYSDMKMHRVISIKEHAIALQDDADSVEHGRYLYQTKGCADCHGQQLTGGAIPGAPPAWPPAANLARGEHSVMSQYPDLATFRHMFRTGQRPDGSAVSNVMPFTALSQVNDVDVEAMYLYLTSGAPATR